MSKKRKELLVFYKRTRRRISMDRVKPQTLAYFSVTLLLVGLAGGLYLHQASEVAGQAKVIRRLQIQKERLHRERVILEGEVAQLDSITRVRGVGKDLDYHLPPATDVKHRVYIECTPTPMARQALIPSVKKGTEDSEIELHVNNTLWKDLVNRFYLWIQTPTSQRRP